MTLILTHSEITTLLDRAEVHKAVEMAFSGLATGHCVNPAPHALGLPAEGAAIPMEAASGERVAVKLLCDLPANRLHGRPTQRSTIMVTSAVTGECLAILDGRAVTAIRTAAASAVATEHLATTSAHSLGLIGAGNLAIQHAYAIAAVRDLSDIVVWSRNDATVEIFRAATEELGVSVVQANSPESVVAATDIVCTLTPSRDPILAGRWLRPGQHVNAIGAPPRRDHREVDSAGMQRARLIVDSHPTVMAKSGAVLVAISEGAITEDDARTELGSVIAGLAIGRTTDDEITMFESVGIGLLDLVTADLVIARAQETGIGTEINLSL